MHSHLTRMGCHVVLCRFFRLCYGVWQIERTYHYLTTGEVERSHTEYDVQEIPESGRDFLLHCKTDLRFDVETLLAHPEVMAGFAIAFNTVSEKGEKLSMELHALFVPDQYVLLGETDYALPPVPLCLPFLKTLRATICATRATLKLAQLSVDSAISPHGTFWR